MKREVLEELAMKVYGQMPWWEKDEMDEISFEKASDGQLIRFIHEHGDVNEMCRNCMSYCIGTPERKYSGCIYKTE